MRSLNRRAVGIALLLGYLGLFVAVVVAHRSPATGYELSLYAATPTVTWIGLGIAATTGLIAALATPRGSRYGSAGLLSIGCAGVALTAMPVIRGYEFYGAGDSLSHLGWAREMAAGTLAPTELLYPGIHTLSVTVSAVAGVPLTSAMQYVVLLVFPAVFLLVVPLVVQLVTDARRAYAIGLVAAALFTPVNNISVHPGAHPTSQAIMFLPVVVFLALTYVFDSSRDAVAAASPVDDPASSPTMTDGGGRVGVTGSGALLAVVSMAMVLIHPQQALNVVLVFIAITGIQLLYRRFGSGSLIAGHRWLGFQTVVVAAAFLLWAPRFDRATGTVSFTIASILGGDTSAGTVVAAKSTSLTALGGSISTVFLRLFLVGLVFTLIAVAVLSVALSGRMRDGWTDAAVRYLGIALVPLSGVFLLMFVISAGDQYFRYQGFIMVFVTVLAAVGLALAADKVDAAAPAGTGRVLVLVLLLVLAPVAAIGYHSSPYMYQPSAHVTESQMSGYSASFEHRQADIEFTGLRGGPQRYVDYYYGTQYARFGFEFPGYEDGTSSQRFNDAEYDRAYGETRYLAITQAGYEREVVLYDGFRYAQEGFTRLETTTDVNRVRSSDGFQLYYVRAVDPEEA
ncbi:hypothetical protein [Halobaculum marinum]|uniref:Dolichyl-phosphate-mannose-protein mannosyltransferase n=1 Tax=Halobaculum marinum TaxID=3031996 RepID=A0ABD5X7I8_9EURY|nr:hypothetical protein [Halobaculum sp. DT55]